MAAWLPQNTVRAFSPLRYFAPAHFASPGLAAQALIRAGKTSFIFNVICHLPKMRLYKC